MMGVIIYNLIVFDVVLFKNNLTICFDVLNPSLPKAIASWRAFFL